MTASPAAADLPAGLVLAAGRSRRMGASKLTMPWKGDQSIVESVVSALRKGGVDRILVVVGVEAGPVELTLKDRRVEFVVNPNADRAEMLESIHFGLRALGDGPPAAVITPGDMPSLQPSTVAALLETWAEARQALCVPSYGGRRGHPVILPRRAWPDVLALGPEQSLRSYLRRHEKEIRHVEVPDPGIREDVDTPQDYRRDR